MEYKIFYYGIGFITLLGILAGYLLQPSDIEEAYILYQDKYFVEAREKYQKLWDGGNKSLSVTIPLSELYLLEGRVNDAVALMEEFIKSNPMRIGARENLGKLYQYDQRPDAYLDNLEVIYQMQPTAHILRELSKIYNYYGEYDKQLRILEELLKNFDPEEEDIRKIAYLYGGRSQYEKAVMVYDDFFDEHIEKMSLGSMSLYASLLLDLKDKKKLLEKSQTFITQFPEQKEKNAVALALRFLERDAKVEALELLLPLEAEAQKNDRLFAVLIEAKIANKREDEAFKELEARFYKGNLPPAALENFVNLAQNMGSWPLQKMLIEKTDLRDLPTELVIGFGPGFVKNANDKIIVKFDADLGAAYIAKYPQLTLMMLLAKNKKPKINLIQKFVRDKKMLVKTKFTIGKLLIHKGHRKYASQILLSISLNSNFENTELFELANLFMDLNYPRKGMLFFEEMRGNKNIKDKSQLEYAWALLAAASGKEKQVLKWLYEDKEKVEERNKNKIKKQKNMALLKDIYFVSYRFRQPGLVLKFATYMYENLPDDENAQHLSGAYIMNDRYSEAATLLEDLNNRGKDVFDTYVFAVNNAALKNPKKYRVKLKGLIDEGLVKYKEELKDNQLEFNNKRREYAFMLFENAYLKDATDIFYDLGKDAQPNHPDVEQLVYIFGKNPPEWGLKWINKRIENSRDKKWLEHLLSLNQIAQVIKLYEKNNLSKTDLTYLQALYETKEKNKIKKHLPGSIKTHGNAKKLVQLGNLAFYIENTNLALDAFEKALGDNPNNPDALKQAGLLLYDIGQVDKAKKYLLKLDTIRPHDYYLQFQLGQIFHREQDKLQAKKHFRKAESEILEFEKDKKLEKPLDVIRIEPLVYAYLGNHKKAVLAYDNLIKKQATYYHAQADVLDILIDDGHYDLAANLASKSIENIEKQKKNKNKNKKSIGMKLGADRVIDKPARLYFALKNYQEAYNETTKLIDLYPRNLHYWMLLAAVQNTRGLARHAKEISKTTLAKQTIRRKLESYEIELAEEIIKNDRHIFGMRQNLILGEGQFAQHQTAVYGQAEIAPSSHLEAEVEFGILDQFEENLEKYDSKNFRYLLTYRYDFLNGHHLKTGMVGDLNNLGAYLKYHLPFYKGYVDLGLEYNNPFWGGIPSFQLSGTRDRVGLESNYSKKHYGLFGQLGANRYDIQSFDNSLYSISLDTFGRYKFWHFSWSQGSKLEKNMLGVQYQLSAEYLLGSQSDLDYQMASFEAHHLGVWFRFWFYKRFFLQSYLAYGLERMQMQHGIVPNIFLSYSHKDLNIQAAFTRTIGSQFGSEAVDIVSLNLFYLF